MPRNLDRRVECVAPVTDPALTARLAEILEVNLADDVLAWELGPTAGARCGRRPGSTPTSLQRSPRRARSA